MSDSPLAPHIATPAELQQRLEVARTGNPFLVYRDGDGAQVVVGLGAERARLTFGRREVSDVPLPWDERVSRLHAEMELVGDDWVVADDGLSANGTYVNDERIQGRKRLRDGDLIRVGGTLIAFCRPADPEAGTALSEDLASVAKVSPAQRRVLVEVCRPALEGNPYAAPPTNGQVAEALVLSIESVKTHMKALFEAFGLGAVPQAQKRSALIERALRTGLVSPRDLEG